MGHTEFNTIILRPLGTGNHPAITTRASESQQTWLKQTAKGHMELRWSHSERHLARSGITPLLTQSGRCLPWCHLVAVCRSPSNFASADKTLCATRIWQWLSKKFRRTPKKELDLRTTVAVTCPRFPNFDSRHHFWMRINPHHECPKVLSTCYVISWMKFEGKAETLAKAWVERNVQNQIFRSSLR